MDVELHSLDPEVYEKAAKLLHDSFYELHRGIDKYGVEFAASSYSCVAINNICWYGTTNCTSAVAHKEVFEEYFTFDENGKWPGYANHPFWNKPPTKQRLEYRINSLLTMAAIVRSAKRGRNKS